MLIRLVKSFAPSAKVLMFGAGLLAYATLGSCTTDGTPDGANKQGLSAPAVEWVSYHTEVPLAIKDFHALASGLIGADAQAGKLIAERELTAGVFVQATADPSTPTQSNLTIAVDDGTNRRRRIAVAPASYQLGQVFITTVDAALSKLQADEAKSPGSSGSLLLEYRVRSAQGGRLSLGVKADSGNTWLVLDVATPQTQLDKAHIGQAAQTSGPTGSIAGTVWFNMTKDDFDFFVDRAYGKGATSRQNFHDFALVPYEWLRLTVEPHLDEKFVNVGFEVLALDGKRVPVAKAPASILAGDLFRSLVSSSMGRMRAQEKAKPGSSTPWSAPFYYDNPDGGGVVQVIAQGNKGIFSIAYSVESPQQPLTDVPFVEYLPVNIPPPDPLASASCEKLGDPKITPAPKGMFQVRFVASKIIIDSPDRTAPLKGTISCSIFHAKDVTVTGPTDGAVSLQDFTVPDADLQAAQPPMFTSQELWGGDYQILCYQDILGKGKVAKGDPVTLPIGSYSIGCNINPVSVEFAILNPQD